MPQPSEDDLLRMMRDPRYQRSDHPEHEAFLQRVAEGFKRLFGDDPARTDATGRLLDPRPAFDAADPPPVPPGWIRDPHDPGLAADPSGARFRWERDARNPSGSGRWVPAVPAGGIRD